jgi:protein OS-9
MRNLAIYLSALTALSQASALRHGSHQLRDLLAFPKYSVDYLNELPLSRTDAERCKLEGVELEEEFTQTRFEGRKKLRGNETEEAAAEKVSLASRLMVEWLIM